MNGITVAVCAYNAGGTLPGLVRALRRQHCPIPCEILVVDNNSSDDTGAIAERLAAEPGAPLRRVREREQGIPHARNRAIEESMGSDLMAFIDADEVPEAGWLAAAVDALVREGAQCAGGRIRVSLPGGRRPRWLTPELLAFLGELDHGPEPLWVADRSTPVWSGNVAYRTAVFAGGLRFDGRYNRRGKGVGGGSDGILFRALLERRIAIRYRPDMVIEHHVEPWKLRRRYFLRLHHAAGRKFGEFQVGPADRAVLGVPPYLVRQAAGQWARALRMALRRDPGALRQAMNGAYATGTVQGCFLRWLRRRSRVAAGATGGPREGR